MRPRNTLKLVGLTVFALLSSAALIDVRAAQQQSAEREEYLPEPMPPGFGVIVNELEGPVFTDSRGRTLYRWPLRQLRAGNVGDRKNAASSCTSEVLKVNSGTMSPYPGGFTLPDVATRKSCQDLWPPVMAAAGARAVGKWTVIARSDGSLQWAYDGFPVYTSDLDSKPGDVFGATAPLRIVRDSPANREPIGPRPNVPPAFDVLQVNTGRLVVIANGNSVYAWDGDEPGKSNCVGACLEKWRPVLAGETSQPQSGWTIIHRSSGVRQWAFRKRPLYTYIPDQLPKSLRGSDEAGWHNVYTQRAPAWPKDFTQQDAHAGVVLADAKGKTIYLYSCADDAMDQQACDHPGAPQEYRLAVCGGGDAARCLKTFPPVVAPADAKAPSQTWTAIDIDPMTGRLASPGQPGALHVWAYRGRPVYTFADENPGDVDGDAWGEFYGYRNGFKAFWLRDEFFYSNAG